MNLFLRVYLKQRVLRLPLQELRNNVYVLLDRIADRGLSILVYDLIDDLELCF